MPKIKSFHYCLKSGRQWNLIDYYEMTTCSEEEAKFIVYDANMCPTSSFETWSSDAKSEVVKHVRNLFRGFQGSIFIDAYEIKNDKRRNKNE